MIEKNGKKEKRMQCGCPVCGTFMGQDERGLESKCRCPACGYSCSACLGTDSVQPKGHYQMPENFQRLLEEEELRRRDRERP